MRFLILLALCLPPASQARMYQWVDADTGTTQLSGKPPAWYRSGASGPRIFVFDAGKIVDDTGIKVSVEHRELLRQRAYDIADEEVRLLREKAIASIKEKQLAEVERNRKREEELEEVPEEVVDDGEDIVSTVPEKSDEEVMGELAEMSVEDMRQLIENWDAMQEEEAKKVLEQ